MFRRLQPKKVNREAPPDVISWSPEVGITLPEAQHTPWVKQIWRLMGKEHEGKPVQPKEPEPSPTKVDFPPPSGGSELLRGPKNTLKCAESEPQGPDLPTALSSSPLVAHLEELEHRRGAQLEHSQVWWAHTQSW